ncbi:MAG: hypothetical protein CMO01_31405 [Thalassobius sp.]|nr:hypothetical protein [Thalassovita sp.]
MENIKDINVLKNFFLKIFTRNYVEKKDYYSRFFGVFAVFTLISIAAQCYSGYSELSFFEANLAFLKLSHPFYFALLTTVLFEIFKSIVTLKFFHEFLGYPKSFNLFFLLLSLSCIGGSIWFSMHGIERKTVKNFTPPPIDEKTNNTDQIFKNNLAQIDNTIKDIQSRYTYQGTVYIPKSGNKWHSTNQVSIDREKLNKLETQKSELISEHTKQRATLIKEFESSLNSYNIKLLAAVQENRYNVIFSESIYIICMIFNCIFSFKSALEYSSQSSKNNQSPPPNLKEKTKQKEVNLNQNTVEEHQMNSSPFNDSNLKIFRNEVESQNNENMPLDNVTETVTQFEKYTELGLTKAPEGYEPRKCKCCGQPFFANVVNESSNKKIYCSKECADMKRKEHTYKKREERKLDKLKLVESNLDSAQQSILWKKTGTDNEEN